MTLHLPIRGVNLLRPGAALFCLLAPLSLHSNLLAQDQDVAEAARQQQAQKTQPATPRHVYTDEDLKRSQILTPEDKKVAEAHRKGLPAPATDPAAIDATNPAPSLGEVARRYRKEKAEREMEAAAAKQKKAPAPFRVELPATIYAEPKRAAAPLRAPATVVRPAPVAPSAVPAHRGAAGPSRVSPFSPRPTMPSYAAPTPSVNPSMLVPSREFQQLKVQAGDSLWRMARRYLGDGARWQELLTLNPGLAAHPDALAAGSVVIVPAAAKPVHGSPRVITVQAGDSLWSLARIHLGRGSDWPRLAHANPQVSDYLQLRVGSQLQLPPE
jgi:nucleoid-associated protein YgaU